MGFNSGFKGLTMLGNSYMVPEFLTAVLMKNSVFWDMTQSRTGNRYQCFIRKYCLHLQGATKKSVEFLYSPWTTMMIGAESSSKTLENINQSTSHNNPQDRNLPTLGKLINTKLCL